MTALPPEFSNEFRDEFAQLIRWRRDVRRFSTRPVKRELLEECLELANLAPSVGLSQPWRFIEVSDRHVKDKIIASFTRCNKDALASYSNEDRICYAQLKLEGLREAPVQLAVFADLTTNKGKQLGQRTMPEMLQYSVVTAIHTFWLAARTHGLGVGWVSIIDPDDVATACNTPDDWALVGYLCIGYPLEQTTAPELEQAGWETRDALNGNVTRV